MAMIRTLFSVLLKGRYSSRFVLAVVISYAFSMAVILGTIGIMDGFDFALKTSLRGANGDVSILHRDSFFIVDEEISAILKYHHIEHFAPQLHTEGYLLIPKKQRGVVIRGIEPQSFSAVTGLTLALESEDQVVLGEDLAKEMGVEIGEEVVLALASGQNLENSSPSLRRLKVVQTIRHGIYLKDSRYAYVQKSFLEGPLNLEGKINLLALNMPADFAPGIDQQTPLYLKKVEQFSQILQGEFSSRFSVRPFWKEFQTLIEAVQVQKLSIQLILQIIVIIAVFNVLAFLTFLNEKKSLELFWLQVLGVKRQTLGRVWILLMLILWGLSCVLSWVLIQLFNLILLLKIFKLPADVYGLSYLSLKIAASDYALVFGASLIWALAISFWGMKKFRRPNLIQELRKEFV